PQVLVHFLGTHLFTDLDGPHVAGGGHDPVDGEPLGWVRVGVPEHLVVAADRAGHGEDGVRGHQSFFEGRGHGDDFGGAARFERVRHSAVAALFGADRGEVVRIVGGVVGHRSDLAVAGHHHHGPCFRVELLHAPVQRLLGVPLQAQVEAEPDGAARDRLPDEAARHGNLGAVAAHLHLLLAGLPGGGGGRGAFQPSRAVAVEAHEADEVGGAGVFRVDALVVAFRGDAVEAEFADLLPFFDRHAALHALVTGRAAVDAGVEL